uniref:Uncharacterized protein n=1 Tax=Anguilla anguilla TaxID=7936 RepID=A0A0E9T9F2_ANGAN
MCRPLLVHCNYGSSHRGPSVGLLVVLKHAAALI